MFSKLLRTGDCRTHVTAVRTGVGVRTSMSSVSTVKISYPTIVCAPICTLRPQRNIDCRIRAELETGFQSLSKELRIAPVPVRCASSFQASSLFAHHGHTVSPLSAPPTAREITLPCLPHTSARDCQHFTNSLESNQLNNHPFLQSPSKPSNNSTDTNGAVGPRKFETVSS